MICTAVAFIGFFALIAEAGPARASVITYVNPAVAVALGIGILGERLTLAMAVAFVLILTGSVLATRTGRRPEPAAGCRARPCGHGSQRLSRGAAGIARLDSRR